MNHPTDMALNKTQRQNLDNIQTNYPQNYDNYIDLLNDLQYMLDYDYDNPRIDDIQDKLNDYDKTMNLR